MGCFRLVLSAVFKCVEQTFNFVGGSRLPDDTAEYGDHAYIIMLSEFKCITCQLRSDLFHLTCSTVFWHYCQRLGLVLSETADHSLERLALHSRILVENLLLLLVGLFSERFM